MSNPLIQQVTREQVEQVLVCVEKGQTTVEDANLIRSYLRMLSSWLELEDDGLRANAE
jgi:hypothetical protein